VPKVLINGVPTDVTLDQIFADDGTTPFAPPAPTGPTFTAEDIENARKQEKDKVYGKLEETKTELAGLREQIGSLTAAEQRRQAELLADQERLQEEARRQEEEGLDAATLIQRKTQEWEQQVNTLNSQWEERFNQSEQERQAAEAIAAREREFNDLKDYTQNQVAANQEKIAPELLPWIQGNTQAEVDAAIARAIETTDQIAAQFQQAFEQNPGAQQQMFAPQPPTVPGTRPTGGPANYDPAGQQSQQLTPEQIKNMPMDQYAALRRNMGIGGQSNARGLFG
jgi:hypothetical protein